MSGDTRRIVAHRDSDLNIVAWSLPEAGGPPEPVPDSADPLQAFVRFDRHSELDGLVWAAQRWLEAVATIDLEVRKAPPETRFASNFGEVTAADLGLEIVRTDCEIVNRQNFGNGGVGAALRGVKGARNRDTLGREGIEGYHKAATKNRGVVAQALHELAHLTEHGFAFFDRSVGLHREYARKRAPGSNFYGTRFAENLECYANDLMLSFAAGLGLDLGRIIPGGPAVGVGPQNARDPQLIYNELMAG